MSTLIAATDFSDAANHAVGIAADLAMKLNARLLIFNAVSIHTGVSAYQLLPDVYEVSIEQSRELLKDLVAEMKKRTDNRTVIEAVHRTGPVVVELRKLCSDEAPVAVFIASHFVTALERLVYGTHAVAIAKHSPVPVIVIPPAGGMNRLERVGIAIDLLSAEAIPWKLLRNWLRWFGPKLDLVYVSSGPDGVSKELPRAVEAAEQLSDFEWNYCFLTNDSAVGGLEEYIRLYQPDLLVLFAGRHGLFHKSVSGPFITAPPVPVMLFSAEIKDPGDPAALP